jgi:hypothetical protein
VSETARPKPGSTDLGAGGPVLVLGWVGWTWWGVWAEADRSGKRSEPVGVVMSGSLGMAPPWNGVLVRLATVAVGLAELGDGSKPGENAGETTGPGPAGGES